MIYRIRPCKIKKSHTPLGWFSPRSIARQNQDGANAERCRLWKAVGDERCFQRRPSFFLAPVALFACSHCSVALFGGNVRLFALFGGTVRWHCSPVRTVPIVWIYRAGNTGPGGCGTHRRVRHRPDHGQKQPGFRARVPQRKSRNPNGNARRVSPD